MAMKEYKENVEEKFNQQGTAKHQNKEREKVVSDDNKEYKEGMEEK